jgi:long-subunit acyl-CoA synthetase (AMP-forming)
MKVSVFRFQKVVIRFPDTRNLTPDTQKRKVKMQVRDSPNVHAMLKETVDRYSEQTAYKWFVNAGRTESATWKQFYEQVKSVSKSLMALGV